MGEIRELISSWSGHVEEASAIFIRTPKYGRGVFIGDSSGGGNAPFSRTDPRIRNIPFATRRPTVKEVQNVHSKLAAVYEVSCDRLGLHVSSCSPKTNPKKPVNGNEAKKDKAVEERPMAAVPADEVEIVDEVEVKDDSHDEGEREKQMSEENEKTARRKKRRRAKKTAESQGCSPVRYRKYIVYMSLKQFIVELPATIQQLMKLCGSGNDPESDALLMTELFQEMGISPITDTGSADLLPIQPAEGTAAISHEVEKEEAVSTNLNGASNLLNGVWNGETVLHVASATGNSSLIPILLLHGANPTIK